MERIRRGRMRAVAAARRLRAVVREHPRAGVVVLALVVLAGIGLGGARLGTGGPAGSGAEVATAAASATPTAATSTEPPGERRGPFTVVRVLDGETLQIEEPAGAVSTVRLLGVDAPTLASIGVQSNCLAASATAALRSMVGGESVVLENDLAAGEVDENGHQLAYVYVDATLVNQALLQGGFVMQYDDGRSYRLQSRFLAAEQSARDAGLGVWAPGDCAAGTR